MHGRIKLYSAICDVLIVMTIGKWYDNEQGKTHRVRERLFVLRYFAHARVNDTRRRIEFISIVRSETMHF